MRQAEVQDDARASAQIVLDGATQSRLQVFRLSETKRDAPTEAVFEAAAECPG